MIEKVQLVNGEYGLRGLVRSRWSDEIAMYLIDRGVVELELNDGKGWNGANLDFLGAFPHLKAFEILDLRISSVAPIHLLRDLRTLKVITYCETEIEFSAFPLLERCSLEWRAKAKSLFHCTTLKRLFLNGYKGKNVDLFASLTQLESLALLNAPVQNLDGLSGMHVLRSLRLANLRRLESLSGLENLVNLEELDINTCRSIHSIEAIRNLTRLRKLYLNNMGDIDSLKPMDKMDDLEDVLFYESTNIVDGDLSPLVQLKKLLNVAFVNRSHYSHRHEDFGVAYSRSASGRK